MKMKVFPITILLYLPLSTYGCILGYYHAIIKFRIRLVKEIWGLKSASNFIF